MVPPVRQVQLGSYTMAVHEFGDPAGEPLFFFHGWPGSGRQASLLDAAARQYGYRVIAPDRPGIGWSATIAARAIREWPALAGQLADALGIGHFAVMGVSGGAPYALACAAAMPARVTCAAIVCGAPPIAEMKRHEALSPMYRTLLWLFQRRPRMVRNLFALARPVVVWRHAEAFLKPIRILLPLPDREALADPENFASVFLCNQDAFLDVDGLFYDATLYARPWEFPLEAIEADLHFWHGTKDENFHWSVARELAARLPTAKLHIVEDEGHFSLPIRHAAAILAALPRGARGESPSATPATPFPAFSASLS